MTTGAISEGMRQILERYHGSDDALPGVFQSLVVALQRSAPLVAHPQIRVRWSMGRFNRRARIPWIALLDRRITRSPRYGIYCDYVVREDLSGLYLSFSQGVSELLETMGRDTAMAALLAERDTMRQHIGRHIDTSLSITGAPDLKATTPLGKGYEASSIAYRFYAKGAIPEDAILLEDLEAALSLYDFYREEMGGRW